MPVWGDRAEILKKSGKNTITIDLNPLSRTSKMSDVSIMDNIVRAIPFMTKIAEDLKTQDKQVLIEIVNDFDNEENLKESLEQIKLNKPDVIIMDVVLSGVDGFSLIEKINELKINSKIIILSSLSLEGFVTKALNLGAKSFFVKHLSPDVFLQKSLELIKASIK